MTLSVSRREILGCSGGVAVGLTVGAIAGAGLTSRPVAIAHGRDEAPKSGFVRLLFNENPYGPPESAKQAIRDAFDGSWMYSHQDVRQLRDVIAEREGLRPENVIVTEGSGELLKIAGLVLGGGREVVSATPSFTMLADYVIRNAGRVQAVALDSELGIDLSAMADHVNERTGVVYICNPNNPTGAILNPAYLRSFIGAVSPRAAIIVDEAYIDFTDEPQQNSMVDQIKAGMNVVVSRTFSKVYGMAGLRIGYGLGRPDVINRLEQRRISIPNRLGVLAALASYEDKNFVASSREMVRSSIDQTYKFLDEMSLRYVPTQGNFIFFDTGRPAVDFYRHMRSRNVLVAPRPDYLETWARVSIGRSEDMDSFAEAARSFFQKT